MAEFNVMKSITLSQEQADALEQIAKDEHRSVSNLVRIIVQDYLDARENPQK